MGACSSSVHKGTDCAMRFSKAKRVFAPAPAKEKALNGEETVKPLGLKSPEFGSKGEIFFDSKAWMDSDCEDDFFSVNGDFTPSRGNTPNYQTSITPILNKPILFEKFPDSKSEPSPTGRKKLADLFQETLQGEQELDAQQNAIHDQVKPNGKPDVFLFHQAATDQSTKSSTPSLSGANSESSEEQISPIKDFKNRKKAAHCCLPSLVQTFSFNERRQKMSSVQCGA